MCSQPAGAVDLPEPTWLTDDQLEAWKLFTLMLHRLPAALEQQLQRDSHLSFLEYYVLAGLSDQPDHTIRMSELAAIADTELSRLSHLVRRLEARGFVRREPDPTNGRYTNAILTDSGYAHLAGAAPGHVARVRELVINALGDTKLRQLRDCSHRVIARIEATGSPAC